MEQGPRDTETPSLPFAVDGEARASQPHLSAGLTATSGCDDDPRTLSIWAKLWAVAGPLSAHLLVFLVLALAAALTMVTAIVLVVRGTWAPGQAIANCVNWLYLDVLGVIAAFMALGGLWVLAKRIGQLFELACAKAGRWLRRHRALTLGLQTAWIPSIAIGILLVRVAHPLGSVLLQASAGGVLVALSALLCVSVNDRQEQR